MTKILIIEDSHDLRKVVKNLIEILILYPDACVLYADLCKYGRFARLNTAIGYLGMDDYASLMGELYRIVQ